MDLCSTDTEMDLNEIIQELLAEEEKIILFKQKSSPSDEIPTEEEKEEYDSAQSDRNLNTMEIYIRIDVPLTPSPPPTTSQS